MDLLAMWRTTREHRRLTIPIVAVTLLMVLYVLAFTSGRWESSASYVLVSPPGPPSAEDIIRDPRLAVVHADNPYAWMDLAVVGRLVATTMGTGRVHNQLVAKGADSRFELFPGGRYGVGGPEFDIQGVGSSSGQAIRTAGLVGKEFQRQLRALQAAQGTDSRYMIRAIQVDAPVDATLTISSRLRTSMGILGVGALLVFVAVSVAEAHKKAVAERRAEANAPAPNSVEAAHLYVASGNGASRANAPRRGPDGRFVRDAADPG